MMKASQQVRLLQRTFGGRLRPIVATNTARRYPTSTCCIRSYGGIGTAAENQINEWLRNRGDEALQNKGKRLEGDRHRHMANSLGVGNDYVHSKILADNNIKPESIERRIKLDQEWKTLQEDIHGSYLASDCQSVEEFVTVHKQQFAASIKELDLQAKKVNEAIISDSLRFNGRSPVPHAKGFQLEERIREALQNVQQQSTINSNKVKCGIKRQIEREKAMVQPIQKRNETKLI